MKQQLMICILFIFVLISLICYMSIRDETEHFKNNTNKLSDNIENIKDDNIEDNIENKNANKKKNIDNKKLNDEILKSIQDQKRNSEENIVQNEIEKEKLEKEYNTGKTSIDVNKKQEITVPNNLIKDSESMRDMFNKLSDSESLCINLERREELKDDLEQIKINEVTLRELDEQDKRINELKDIVRHLRIENTRAEKINKVCQSKNQNMINNDYNLVKRLASKNLLNDQSLKLDLNLSEGVKKQIYRTSNPITRKNKIINPTSLKIPKSVNPKDTAEYKNKQLNQYIQNVTKYNIDSPSDEEITRLANKCNIDTSKYVHISKLNNNVCRGCIPQVLKEHSDEIYRDFN